jgi:hypothetical protein
MESEAAVSALKNSGATPHLLAILPLPGERVEGLSAPRRDLAASTTAAISRRGEEGAVIDPMVEELITPNEATRYYPRSAKGKRVHVSRVYRDFQVGHRGVKLESLQTPRLVTSKEAIARFFRSMSAMPSPESTAATSRSRARDDVHIERELDQLGI